jgi:hypothetical protein
MKFEIYIGHDAREQRAWDVCARSIQAHASAPVSIHPISRHTLGVSYQRATETQHGRLWDVASNAPMATDFSLARFWVPAEAGRAGWALFVDADFLFRADVWQLAAAADPACALQVVKHQHEPAEHLKMDNQIQTRYPRKNQSSCMLFNLSHAAHRRLDEHALNRQPGLWLHQFGWLRDDEIGDLDPLWNVLDGQPRPLQFTKAYHYTRGTPDMVDCATEHNAEWWSWLTPREIGAWLNQREADVKAVA